MGKSHSIRIFIVDKDESYRQEMEEILKKELGPKATIQQFSKGEDCMANLTLKPDIILLGFNFGENAEDKHGIYYLKRILKRSPKVGVIMISDQKNLDIAVDSVHFGAYHYVQKNEGMHLRTELIIQKLLKEIKSKKEAQTQKTITRIIIFFFLLVAVGMAAVNHFFPDLL